VKDLHTKAVILTCNSSGDLYPYSAPDVTSTPWSPPPTLPRSGNAASATQDTTRSAASCRHHRFLVTKK
jgi:hypothetical protein